MSKVKTITINGEQVTLQEYREMWKWHRKQFSKLKISEEKSFRFGRRSNILFDKFDEVVDELIENRFDSQAWFEDREGES